MCLSRHFQIFCNQDVAVLRPRNCRNNFGLGSFHFARHYFGNRFFFLFLQVLRCFSSLGLLQHCWWLVFNQPGFPIRTSADQFVFANPRGFSQLTTSFVAYRSQGILRSLLFSSSWIIILPHLCEMNYAYEIVVRFKQSEKPIILTNYLLLTVFYLVISLNKSMN